jgi:hypothetical protein
MRCIHNELLSILKAGPEAAGGRPQANRRHGGCGAPALLGDQAGMAEMFRAYLYAPCLSPDFIRTSVVCLAIATAQVDNVSAPGNRDGMSKRCNDL